MLLDPTLLRGKSCDILTFLPPLYRYFVYLWFIRFSGGKMGEASAWKRECWSTLMLKLCNEFSPIMNS